MIYLLQRETLTYDVDTGLGKYVKSLNTPAPATYLLPEPIGHAAGNFPSG